MKIAFFSDCYLDLTGGIVTSINAQKRALEALGHEVGIFTTAYPKTPQALGKLAKNHIYVVPSCKYLVRGATPVSRRPGNVEQWLLREHPELKDYDIFYIHYESGCSIAGLRLGKKLSIPTVQVMHGREDMGVTGIIPRGLRTAVATLLNWFHSWYLPHPTQIKKDTYLADTLAKAKMWTLMVNHANAADLVLTPSRHFRDKLVHYGVTRPVKVFPNGYPDDKFSERPPAKVLQPGAELRIIWHSRVSGEKRIMVLLQALTGVAGPYRLDVYGDGPDLKKAQKFSTRHQLNVVFHGAVPFAKLRPAILKAHLDALVSYNYDTFGMTLIEAEAYGTPVLICDPDLREVVPRGGYILSKSASPDDLAIALSDLLAHPAKIHQLSTVMLEHRDEVLISHRIHILIQLFQELAKH